MADAAFAAKCGADFLGVVLSPSSKRCAPIDAASAILALDVPQKKILVFGYDDATYIQRTFASLAQESAYLQVMADHPHIDTLLRLAPPERIIPSISAAQKIDKADLERWEKFPLVLFDSHNAAAKTAGGTGKTFNPEHVLGIERPFLLAGGLTPENVASAISVAHPFGVDVASGVESSPGIKNHDKILQFIQITKRSGASQSGSDLPSAKQSGGSKGGSAAIPFENSPSKFFGGVA
ncbi:MAG: N-(5'-phosphoribosyl)anthranilate isomerase [Turneriella sp.]|nr:N-(5'-phosphoribosyl)anthranilate isomerase [Turneriella sp.]